MRRRLLLIEDNPVDQTWMLEQLRNRFRAITVTCVKNLNEAQRTIADAGCDIIVTALKLVDGESASNIIHVLQAYAPGVPILALASKTSEDDESVTDVLTVGVRHILFKDDLQRDYSQLTSAIIDTIRELTTREANRDVLSERVQALSQKVWDVDDRMQNTESLLGKLTLSIDALTIVIDKRGGLEDRVKELEKAHNLAIRIILTLGGLIGTGLCAGAGMLINWLFKH